MRGSRAPGIDVTGHFADPITVVIKSIQKACLVCVRSRIDLRKRLSFDEKGDLDGSVIAPEAHAMPGAVVASTWIGKVYRTGLHETSQE